jgi:hypothetical protein
MGVTAGAVAVAGRAFGAAFPQADRPINTALAMRIYRWGLILYVFPPGVV